MLRPRPAPPSPRPPPVDTGPSVMFLGVWKELLFCPKLSLFFEPYDHGKLKFPFIIFRLSFS